MNKYLIIGIAIIVGISGYAINRYGQARFDAGYLQANNENLKASNDTSIKDSNDKERVQDETNNMSDSDIDIDLSKLGIMRQPTDY